MTPELLQFIRLMPEPTFLITSDETIVFGNSAASDLTGIKNAALPGTELSTLVEDDSEKIGKYVALCSRSRELLPGGFTWFTSGRKTLEVRCDGAVIQPKTENAPAIIVLRVRPKAEATDQFVLLNQKIVALSKEIIERKRIELQRDDLLLAERAARIEAERVSKMKDEFLATLSHELRTPLNAILGWSQLIGRNKDLPQNAKQGLEIIERAARSQARLIEDLLDMSRIISGKIRLDVQRLDLATIIEAAVTTVVPAAEAKGVRLQVALDPIAGPVKGDPNRLQQVVWNLVSNAVKFTPKGGRVQVFLERVNSHLEITVSDTGEGIEPHFLPHVFDRFVQADASTTRVHGGLGLGLSIVKQLVDLHGGSVRAKSSGKGKGSTFIVSLPFIVVHEEQEELPHKIHPNKFSTDLPYENLSLKGVKILVVDDEPDARELIKRLLKDFNAEVETAESAHQAMRILKEYKPDILISDIGMPRDDGYEFIRQVRALSSEEGGAIPAIALTAFARSEDRTRAIMAGFQIHLSKPIEPSELVVIVGSFMGLTGSGQK
jgi:signal transduction histidine kinase